MDNFVSILSSVVIDEVQTLDTAYDLCTPAFSEFQATICKLYCELFLGNVRDESDCLPSEILERVRNESREIYKESELSKTSEVQNDKQKLISQEGSGSKGFQDIEEIKHMILTSLKSESYEVRKMVLLQLKNKMSASRQGGMENIADSACSNTEIMPQLLEMLDKESHEECKIELLG